MKKIRVLVAAVVATFALTVFPAPAQATHHCAPLPVTDRYGISHTLWLGCEYGVHQPVAYARYVACWLTGVC